MSLWTRTVNAFRGDRLNRELNEEFESHLEEAIAAGCDPEDARRAFGSMLRQREASRRVRVLGWLDGLRADVIFALRQLRRNRVSSAAAILSLALAMGACTGAFRVIDALLLRPLPVDHPERLYAVSYDGEGFQGKPYSFDSGSYPMFEKMRAAVKDEAQLIAVSYVDRADVTYASDEEMEKAHRQFVSGWMFNEFGLKPVLGRLLREDDDLEPGKHPVAVISYDYWMRRFGRDPNVVGRKFRQGKDVYEIAGVLESGFTGTEPGTMTDIFVPTMMRSDLIPSANAFWLRTFVLVKPGTAMEPLRAKLQALYVAMELERSKGWKNLPKELTDAIPRTKLELVTAGEGVSGMQKDYRNSLNILGVLVLLVLLIACVNVANLMTALAAARAREMALRVSIGAGRWRLVQMVLVESSIVAFLAATIGGLLAWWSAPTVVGMINPPDNPARLVLPADWRVLGFGMALIVLVTLLFGLIPALRASGVKPVSALKGGEDPHAPQKMLHGMIAAQVAFCFLIVFVSELFTATFDKLSHVPLGFSPNGVVTLETATSQGLPPAVWEQLAEHLRALPGVQTVSLAGWPLMGEARETEPISVHNGPPSNVFAFFLTTSPGFLETMKIPLLSGRDFRGNDANPQVAIVNMKFAQQYFGGANPVGQRFKTTGSKTEYEIVGLVGDAAYHQLRDPMMPVVYTPFQSLDQAGALKAIGGGTVLVRGANPAALEPVLRREIHGVQSAFRVSNVRTQQELIDAQTVRERLLVTLGVFFAAVALLLAGIGLYGVVNYSVLQRRREIGIRVAVGARGGAIARLLTGRVFSMVAVGVVAGLGLGLASARYMESLLFQVKASDFSMLVAPSAVILAAAVVATVPGILRALRIDPAEILRAE
jgi:putative ABC transport system permease protein